MDELPIVFVDLDFPLLAIGMVWLAIVLGMLAWGGTVELLRAMRSREKAPFSGMLARRGFTLMQAEEVAGFTGVREAAGRCAACGARDACRRALRWGWLGFEAPRCPNAAFFARVAGERVP